MLTKNGLPLSQHPTSQPPRPKAGGYVELTSKTVRSPERLVPQGFYSLVTEALLKLHLILSFQALSETVSASRDYSVRRVASHSGPTTAHATQVLLNARLLNSRLLTATASDCPHADQSYWPSSTDHIRHFTDARRLHPLSTTTLT